MALSTLASTSSFQHHHHQVSSSGLLQVRCGLGLSGGASIICNQQYHSSFHVVSRTSTTTAANEGRRLVFPVVVLYATSPRRRRPGGAHSFAGPDLDVESIKVKSQQQQQQHTNHNNGNKPPPQKQPKRKPRTARYPVFEVMLKRLQTFHDEHGHTWVTSKNCPDEDLIRWTQSLRKNYRHQVTGLIRPRKNSGSQDATTKTKRTFLSEERLQELQRLNFSWESPAQKKRRQNKTEKAMFEDMFERLDNFHKQHGHTWVTANNCKDKDLIRWTKSVRQNYRHQFTGVVRKPANTKKLKNNKTPQRPFLSEPKAQMLRRVNFCWDPQQFAWDQQYQKMAAFLEENSDIIDGVAGGCVVGSGSIQVIMTLLQADEEDPSLANWAQNQRRDFRWWLLDLPSNLTPSRLEALEELGLFQDYKSAQEVWVQQYQYLVEYHKIHGHANVPQRYQHPVTIPVINNGDDDDDADDGSVVQERQTTFALGRWCMNQRKARHQWDLIHEEYNKEQIGRVMNMRKGKGGASTATTSRSIDIDSKLRMTSERMHKLDALNFAWTARDARWRKQLDRLKAFYQKHGHIQIPPSDTSNQDLRQWLNIQRHYYQLQSKPTPSYSPSLSKSTNLTPERISAMEEAIPDFKWKAYNPEGPSTEDWSNLFSAMRDKGLAPGMRPKQHWFEGINPFASEVKVEYTEEELVDLFNKGDDDDDDDDEDLGDDFVYPELDDADVVESVEDENIYADY